MEPNWHEIAQRVAQLETHREHDVETNRKQTERINEAVTKIDEIYNGWKWLVRIGKFCAWLAALGAAVTATLKGLK